MTWSVHTNPVTQGIHQKTAARYRGAGGSKSAKYAVFYSVSQASNYARILKIPLHSCSERLRLLDGCCHFLEARGRLLLLAGRFWMVAINSWIVDCDTSECETRKVALQQVGKAVT